MAALNRHLYEGKATRGAASSIRYLKQVPDELIAGRTIIDLGCNEGLVSEYLVKDRKAGRVVGFEPHPQAFARAQERAQGVAQEVGQGFEVRPLAVMSEPGGFTLSTAADDSAAQYFCNSSIKPDGEKRKGAVYHEVVAVAFRDVLEELQPSGIKMDIEGSEYDLLLKTDLLPCVEWLCVELHGLKTHGAAMLPHVVDRMAAAGLGVQKWPVSLKIKDGAPNTFNPFCEMNFVRGAVTSPEHEEMVGIIRRWAADNHRLVTPRYRSAARRALLEQCYGNLT